MLPVLWAADPLFPAPPCPPPPQAFLSFRRVVENANVIMATYADEALGDTQVGGRGSWN